MSVTFQLQRGLSLRYRKAPAEVMDWGSLGRGRVRLGLARTGDQRDGPIGDVDLGAILSGLIADTHLRIRGPSGAAQQSEDEGNLFGVVHGDDARGRGGNSLGDKGFDQLADCEVLGRRGSTGTASGSGNGDRLGGRPEQIRHDGTSLFRLRRVVVLVC